MNDVEIEYDNFWKNIVENKDGTINKERLKKELYDFSLLIKNTSYIFDILTHSKISKPLTNPNIVIRTVKETLSEG